jgi:hypothetical protein
MGRINTLIACGLIATVAVGTVVAADASGKTSAAKACVSKSKTLSLISHGKCAKHTRKVTLGARGPSGAGPAYLSSGSAVVSVGHPKTLTTVTLPKGEYLLTESGWVSDPSEAHGAIGTCKINDGSTPIAITAFNVLSKNPPDNETDLPFSAQGVVAGPVTLTFDCVASAADSGVPDSDGYAVFGKLTALKVTAVHGP